MHITRRCFFLLPGEDLTDRQRLAYSFIRDYEEHNRRPPTLREISTGIGARSVTSARQFVQALVRKGYLEFEPGCARGIRLLRADDYDSPWDARTMALRLLEADDASRPDVARPSVTVHVDMLFLRGIADAESCVVVRAGDFAMAADGVLRGDLVIVEPAAVDRLSPGMLVAYRSAGEFLIRRYVDRRTSRLLAATDRTFAVIDMGSRAMMRRIVGRVVGVMRRL